MKEEWEKVAEVREYEAEMIKEMLEENGIPVLVRQSDYAMPVIFGSGGMVEVLVPKDFVDKAKEIIEGEG